MKRNIIYMVIAFTIIWIVLTESLTWQSALSGFVVGLVCVFLCLRYLPAGKIAGVNYARFILYIFYLMGQMYWAAISTIRLIILGAKADIVEIDTEISNEFLTVMFANSITLVPGSVTLNLDDKKLTVLLLRDKSEDEEELKNTCEMIKHKLEKRLLKTQK